MNFTKSITKAGIILIQQSNDSKQRILITFSKKSQKFGFPKGSREDGKDASLFDTAMREFEEETGYQLLIKERAKLTFEIDNNVYFIIYAANRLKDYIKKVHETIPDKDEIEYIEWKTPEEMMMSPSFLKKCNLGLKSYLLELKKIEENKIKYL